MGYILSNSSLNKHTEEAVKEITRALHPDPRLVLFFASTTHPFEQVTAIFHATYPHSEVVGLTTTGEIGPEGFLEFGLSAMSFSKDIGKVKSVLMKDISKYPIFYRNDLLAAAKEININVTSKQISEEGVALVFPNGLLAAEEKMLSIVNSVFDYEGFPMYGGTAGDDAKFVQTFVSVNGEISSTGGAVVFMKPVLDLLIMKENIFKSTGKKLKITKADTEQRIVYEIDGRKAATVYAQALGIKESELARAFMFNPLGRRFNDEIFIASPFQVLSNGAIQFYCQLFQDSVVEILEPTNPLEVLQETLASFTSYFSNIEGVVACNCILRKLQFQSQNMIPDLNKQLSTLPHLGGFSSYGEQINKSLINQTLVLLGFGTKR